MYVLEMQCKIYFLLRIASKSLKASHLMQFSDFVHISHPGPKVWLFLATSHLLLILELYFEWYGSREDWLQH